MHSYALLEHFFYHFTMYIFAQTLDFFAENSINFLITTIKRIKLS